VEAAAYQTNLSVNQKYFSLITNQPTVFSFYFLSVMVYETNKQDNICGCAEAFKLHANIKQLAWRAGGLPSTKSQFNQEGLVVEVHPNSPSNIYASH